MSSLTTQIQKIKVPPTGTIVGSTDIQTLTNKTLTSPIISTISNTGVLTLPTSTDTLVGRATTDTLTNKSLSDSTTFIVDNSDATKKVQFECSGITTATTRTLTIPDANTILVGTDTTQTLTNKSLSDLTTFIVDNTDATKKLQFECSGITTATTRTLTIPNTSGTILLDTTAFLNGGNSFGAAATIGTNDANTLGLKTNNTTRMIVSNSLPTLTFQGNGIITSTGTTTINSAGQTTISMITGAGSGAALSGALVLATGGGGSSGTGNVSLTSGAGNATAGSSGTVLVTSGTGYGTGAVTISTGNAVQRISGLLTLQSGNSGNNDSWAIGNVLIQTGNSGSTNNDGADVIIKCTRAVGTGTIHGKIQLIYDKTNNYGFTVEGDGTLSTNTPSYESLITSDGDIPNRKYILDSTYTMTNKSLSDSTTFIIDNSDTTKRAQFQCSGITTATTRTLTIPDANITLIGSSSAITTTGLLQTTSSNVASVIKSDFSKTTAPTITDDVTLGYIIGSRWIDVTADEEYIALDVSTGAAVWKATTSAGGGGILTNPQIYDTSTDNTYNFAVSELTANRTITLPLLVSNDTFVFESHSQTLTNKTLTAPVISTISNTGVLTLPTSTDTLVGRATTDTLTNKSLSDSTTFIIDNSDVTKRAQFQCSGITTATTRTLTIPDEDTILVGTDATQTLTNKTLTSPIISQISNTGVLTLPTSTDTLVGRATTDTLTNKSLSDSTTFIIDNSDTTKKAQFQCSGITTATTRTLTIPDEDTTIVGTNATQTLTNKTLTSPIISTISNTGVLTLPTSTDTLVGRATTDTLTNKTLTSPVISTISNTGTLTLPTSTDTIVGRATTDTLTNKTFGDDLNMNSHKIIGLATPTSATDAVTKGYVDSFISGLDSKQSVRVTSTEDLDSNTSITPTITYVSTDGVSTRGQITATLATSDTFILDSVTLSSAENNTRILLKDQIDQEQNGIWTITISGTDLTLDRATDFDQDAEVTPAAYVFVEEGTLYGDSGWVLTTNDPVTIGGSSGSNITWTQFSSAGQIIAGDGLLKTGNTLDVDLKANGGLVIESAKLAIDLGASSITGTLAVSDGGTGATTLTSGNFLEGNGTGTIISTKVVPSGDVVGTTDTQTLTNKTLTSPIISTISNTGTLTLPTSTDTLVGRDTTDTLTNKTLTAPIISTISNTGTVTLPTSTDTLVGRATTDTLTNKSLSDSTTFIIDNSDATKKAQFECSGITTGTTRTITFPDVNGTLMVDTVIDTLYYKLNGNSFGVQANIGTNDSNILAFETNNTQRMSLAAAAYQLNLDAPYSGTFTVATNGAVTTGQNTAAISVVSGSGNQSTSGTISIGTGNAIGGGGTSGPVNIFTGATTSNSGSGLISLTTGNGAFTSGNINLTTGTPTSTAVGTTVGSINIVTGNSPNSSQGTAVGSIALTCGTTTGGNKNGGNITLSASPATGAGTNGKILLYGNKTTNFGVQIETDGTLSVANTTTYEALVTSDGDFPNRKYVLDSTYTMTNKSLSDSTTFIIDNSDATKRAQFECSGITTGTTRTLTIPDASTTIVGTDTSQTLTNKTLTAPVISSISNTGVLTLPTSTDTLVGRDTTDTLTNKSLSDLTTFIVDNTDATKKAQFECSGITTATTRTLTIPDANTTIVGTDTTQTLTNKTLTDSTTFFQDDADNTKKVQFQCSGITTATTRTLTIPNTNGTILLDTTAFLNGGNSFAAAATIGTNDNNTFAIRTNGASRMTFASNAYTITTGAPPGSTFTIGGNSLVNTVGSALVINSGGGNQSASGAITIASGGTVGGGASSGAVSLLSGDSLITGAVTVKSGTASTTNSGGVTVGSGNGTILSGTLTLSTGNSTTVASNIPSTGTITIQTGDTSTGTAVSGTIGNINLICGTANAGSGPRTGGSITLSPSPGINGGTNGKLILYGNKSTSFGVQVESDGTLSVINTTTYENLVTSDGDIPNRKYILDSTYTMTNKSLSDSTTYIIDNSDDTKRAQFECSGITTATTRTLTVPDADITLIGSSSAITTTGFVTTTGSNVASVIKSNFSATTAPSTSDDNTQGYGVGSRWYDISNLDEYVLLDPTTSTAVWKKTTP